MICRTTTSVLMPTTEADLVRVAVGVIRRNNLILIAKRPDDIHQGGLWEFPGGKIQLGESDTDALARELREELGIEVDSAYSQHLFPIPWDYGDKKVVLEIYLVEDFSNDPEGREGQPIKWVSPRELAQYAFPEANEEIISWLLDYA